MHKKERVEKTGNNQETRRQDKSKKIKYLFIGRCRNLQRPKNYNGTKFFSYQ